MQPWSEPVVLLAPTSTVVDIDELALHVRQDSSDDDDTLQGLIYATERACEKLAGRVFVERTLGLYLDRWPCDAEILLPYPPLQEILGFTYYTETGETLEFAPELYEVDTIREPGRLVLKRNSTWPADILRAVNGIFIEYVAGYGEPSDVPENFRLACKKAAQWHYQHPGADEMPRGVQDLLNLEVCYHA